MPRSIMRCLAAVAIALSATCGALVLSTAAQADSGITPAPACPASWTCTTMPNGGGAIQIGPANGVAPVGGVQPFVYIRGYGFHPGDAIREHFCSLVTPLTPSMLCVVSAGTLFTGNPSANLKVLSDGTFAYSTQVPLNPQSNGTPFAGQVPYTKTTGQFFCDGGAATCGIVITDGNLANPYTNVPNSGNSTSVAISYNLSPADCPGRQTLVTSESDQMMAPLLPAVDRLSCATSHPFVLFNTEQTGNSAVSDLYNNVRNTSSTAIRIAFTTDPEDPAQQKYLPKGHFVLIPVGLTSVVTAFSSQVFNGNVSFPQTVQNLSANMNAGIFTGLYTDPGASVDPTSCAGGCQPPPCTSPTSCSLLQLDSGHPGYYLAKNFAAQPLAVQSGSTDALTHWICNSPKAKVPWGTTSSVEAQTGAQVMLDGLKQGGHPYLSCPAGDQWPAEQISNALWTAGSNPPDQIKAMNAALPPVGSGAIAVADFAYMYAPWADYLGLQTAGELNTANEFQQPTATSLDAAVADSTLNSDGTLATSYSNTSDTAAYPMPAVIYAAVSTDAMPASEKADIQGALSSLLNVTGGADTASLPNGYVPLPSSLYKQATAEVAQAVGNPSFKITDVLPQLASATPPPSSNGFSGGFSGGSFAGSAFGNLSNFALLHRALSQVQHNLQVAASVPSSSPLYGTILLSASSSRMVIPWVILLGVMALVLGAVLMSWGGITRIVRSGLAKSAASEGLSAEGDAESFPEDGAV